MNFWPVVFASIARFRFTALAFAALVIAGTAVSVAIISQERALREGSARAAERFDVIVAPQGSRTDALLTGVYLQSGAARLLSPETTAAILNDDLPVFASPLAFGDQFNDNPIVGATMPLPEHVSGGSLADGRTFAEIHEAVVGSRVPLAIGAEFAPEHGTADHDEETAEHHEEHLVVVGRMKPTGSPWDDAIIVPVEFVWEVHEEGREEAAEASGEHEHDHEAIGGPYATDNPGVPAVVLRAASVADAYRLRTNYNSDASMAFFPAEVLVELYQTLGDVSFILFVMSLVSEALVILAIISGLFIVFRLLLPQLVTLRALGAPRRFVMGATWGFSAVIFTVGVLLGLVSGMALAVAISSVVEARTGIALTPGIGRQELTIAFAIWALGLIAGLLPAAYVTRKPIAQMIRLF